MSRKLLQIVITGVGGQGVLSASKMLGMAAGNAGLQILTSAVHGMAQRGGVVETYVIIGERFSPIIDPGEADMIVGFEPVETLRALPRGSKHTIVISNTQPVIPFFCSFSGAKYPGQDEIFNYIILRVKKLITVNANQLAQNPGSVLAMNMTMLGLIAGTQQLPFDTGILEKTIAENTSARFREVNVKAFKNGVEYIS